MLKPKSINELLCTKGKPLSALRSRSRARLETLDHVRAALSPTLAATVVTAGLEGGALTLGVAGSHWASRLRYSSEALRTQVSQTMAVPVLKVRIKVIPPTAGT
jgi:hypothetical protein